MIIKEKLVELANQYPKDVVLYNQDLKTLMKLPGRIPGEFDTQLLEFLKVTNGALIMDYRFYGFKNLLLTPSLNQNLMDKWYEWQHIAGTIIPFAGSSSNFGFGFLQNVSTNGAHPIVYFTEFPEDTQLVASCFNAFFGTFLYYVERSLANGETIEIDVDNWPFDTDKLLANDPDLGNLLESEEIKRIIGGIGRY